jgi:hypothetical protein
MSQPHGNDEKNEKALLNLSPSIRSNKIIFIVCLTLVVALITDVYLARTAELYTPNLSRNPTTIGTFILLSLVCFVGQFMILYFVRNRSKGIHTRAKERFYKTYKVAIAAQITLSLISFIVIFQLLVTSNYFIFALIASTTITYGLGLTMMAFLMKSFFSWFVPSKNFVILAYGISAAILVIHLGFTTFSIISVLLDVPTEIRTPISRTPFFLPGTLEFILNTIRSLTSVLSFSVLWIATVLLLHHYSQKVGKIKYWILVSLPLVYFLSQFPTLFFNLFTPLIREDPIFYGSLLTFLFTLSKPAGGILFGIAFWTVARNLRSAPVITNYLLISAIGFVLLFASDHAIVLIGLPYPPFGLAAVSFVGLSSYLIFVGIYYSAISLSHNDRIRSEIKKFALSESKLLDSIRSAQLEKEISERVKTISQNQDYVAQSLGIPSSMDEENIRKYLDDVVRELKSARKEDNRP